MTFNITCKHCGTVQPHTIKGGTWISYNHNKLMCWYCKKQFIFCFQNPKKDFNNMLFKKYKIIEE